MNHLFFVVLLLYFFQFPDFFFSFYTSFLALSVSSFPSFFHPFLLPRLHPFHLLLIPRFIPYCLRRPHVWRPRCTADRLLTALELPIPAACNSVIKIIWSRIPLTKMTVAQLLNKSGVKRLGRESDHSLLSSADVKNGTPPPHTSSWRGV
jgi:hypothetical protein